MDVTTSSYAVGNLWGMKRPRPAWKTRPPELRRPIFLALWRIDRGMSQEELADRLRTTKATISRIENGKEPYSQDFLEMVADILGIHHSVLLSRGPLPGDAPVRPAAARGGRR